MGTISSAVAYYGLSAAGTPTKTQSAGTVQIGVPSTSTTLPTATKAYCVSARLGEATQTLLIDLGTGVATPSDVAISQVETATGAGTVTVAGNASVIVTAAGVVGSPLTFAIPVSTGTASFWMASVRNFLLTDSSAAPVRAFYNITDPGASPSTTLVLTAKIPADTDATLNVAIATGTATGITAAPTSANTTAGVGGVELLANTGDGKDFEGVSLGAMLWITGILIKCSTGSVTISVTDAAFGNVMFTGDEVLHLWPAGKATTSLYELQCYANTNSSAVEITFICE